MACCHRCALPFAAAHFSLPNFDSPETVVCRLSACGARFSDDLPMPCFSFWQWTRTELLQRKSARRASLPSVPWLAVRLISWGWLAQEAMACGLSPDQFVFSNRDLSEHRCEAQALGPFHRGCAVIDSCALHCVHFIVPPTGRCWPICSWTIPE